MLVKVEEIEKKNFRDVKFEKDSILFEFFSWINQNYFVILNVKLSRDRLTTDVKIP